MKSVQLTGRDVELLVGILRAVKRAVFSPDYARDFTISNLHEECGPHGTLRGPSAHELDGLMERIADDVELP